MTDEEEKCEICGLPEPEPRRWPDPIDAAEHEAFARLCARNFAVIDALFGKNPEVAYDGKRTTTPNLGLVVPGLADFGWAHDLAENFLKIDAAFRAVVEASDEKKPGN